MEFDIEKWEKNCIRYEKNKKGMRFQACCVSVDGELKLRLTDLKPEYEKFRKAVKALTLDVIKGGNQMMASFLKPSYVYSQEDAEAQMKILNAHIKKNQLQLLNVLLSKGQDEFIEVLDQHATILKNQYLLSVVSYHNGCWMLPDGKFWTGKGWQDPKDGLLYKGGGIDFWKAVLGSEDAALNIMTVYA